MKKISKPQNQQNNNNNKIMSRQKEKFKRAMKNRVMVVLFFITLLFVVLIARLYYLQIIHGKQSQQDLKLSIMREVTIPAARGNIYDRNGKPLAINTAAFAVKIDDSIDSEIENKNEIIKDIVLKRSNTEEAINDILPITKEAPYKFTFPEETAKKDEESFKIKIGMPKDQRKNATAEDCLKFMEEKFEIPSELSDAEKRQIMTLGVYVSNKNIMILSLIDLLNENNEKIIDELPISSEKPYSFLFDGNVDKEIEFKQSVAMDEEMYNYSASETIDYLADFFGYKNILPETLKRQAVSVKYLLYLNRYYKYKTTTIATDISSKTMAELEEKQYSYPGVTIDEVSMREYPEGKYFSHILGYIRTISESEYEEMKNLKAPDGTALYSSSDLIGKTGIEKVNELELNGIDGKMLVEVDSGGKRISTLETSEPVPGKDVYLTIDSELQKKTYDIIEETLTERIINRLTVPSKNYKMVSEYELFDSMIDCNTISIKKIMKATSGEQLIIKNQITNGVKNFDINSSAKIDEAKAYLRELLENKQVSTKQLVLVLYEQGEISADEDYLQRIRTGAISPLSVIIQKLRAKEITPSDTNLDPCTASAIVTDVNTGEVLALVTYPSYDNNRLVNNFDNEYYLDLLNDPTTPLINRPLSQKKAPGSTLKMAIAMAGLETGVITPETTVTDKGIFKDAGIPYAKCWAYGTSRLHGDVNVSHAIEVSCNYFFYELAYRMGNDTNDKTLYTIETFNEYMAKFGLDEPSGIELGEAEPNMANPEYKKSIVQFYNPEAEKVDLMWTDGDNIRAAIGQSVNNFTVSHMAKYVSTLANGGTRYKLHLISSIVNSDNTEYKTYGPVVEEELNFKPENLKAVTDGMLLVTRGTHGTLKSTFEDLPINVAAKSGTAQEDLSRNSHTLFVGYAPYETPQICVSVMVPYGDVSPAPSAVIAKEVISEYMGLSYTPVNSNLKNVLTK